MVVVNGTAVGIEISGKYGTWVGTETTEVVGMVDGK